MPVASKPLVLITGVSGFLGSATALEFLANGWRVRGTMRSQSKVDAWEAKYPHHKPNLEWAIVESLSAPGAFEAAVKGVDAVAHVASPFTRSFDAPAENVSKMLEPAVKGTTSVLEAAAGEPSVKAVVITSSLAAAQDPSKGADVGFTRTAATWSSFEWDAMVKEEVPIVVYLGSKQFAEQAAWKFVEERKPAFRLTTIVPPMILGPALQPLANLKELNLSSGAIWNIVDAQEIPPTHVPVFINVLDCAKAHYESIVRDVAGGQRYLLIGGENDATEIAKILREEFPEQAHRIPTEGTPFGPHWGYDASPAEKELGIKYTPLRETVKQAGEQLFAAEKALKAEA